MDTKKLVLFIIFSTSLLFLWEEWQKEQQRPLVQSPGLTQGLKNDSSSALFQNETPVPGEKLTASTQPIKGLPSQGDGKPFIGNKLESGEKILIKTDIIIAEIDTAGGDLRRLELLLHPDKTDKNKAFALLQNQSGRINVAQSGLIGGGLLIIKLDIQLFQRPII